MLLLWLIIVADDEPPPWRHCKISSVPTNSLNAEGWKQTLVRVCALSTCEPALAAHHRKQAKREDKKSGNNANAKEEA